MPETSCVGRILELMGYRESIKVAVAFFPKQCGHTEGVLTVRGKRGLCRSRWGRARPAFFL